MIPQQLKKKVFGSFHEFAADLTVLKQEGRTIVFTNGCFDVLHAGHIHCLQEASLRGDFLIVGLNTDSSVRRIKGRDRPLKDQSNRAVVLAAINVVGAVILFEQDTPIELIKQVNPDVLVKGEDYEMSEIIGADFVHKKGGQVVRIPLLKGLSSTMFLKQQQ